MILKYKGLDFDVRGVSGDRITPVSGGSIGMDNRSADYQLVCDPIYKGDTTMEVSLRNFGEGGILSGDSLNLNTVIKEDGKKDRVFTKLLNRMDCPKSKAFYSWAIERMEAKVKGKLRKGYTATKGEVGYKEPMRYIDWADRVPQHEGKSYIVQPKLNGVRCVAYPNGDLISRGNIKFDQPHISKELIELGLTHPLDCELYIHGESFEVISGGVRRGNFTPLELWVFDVVDLEVPYEERYAGLLKLSTRFKEVIKRVPALVTYDPEPLMDKFVALGYEGGVVGDPKGMWTFKRTKHKWKLKPVYDEEFEIVEVGWDSLPEGRCIKFKCVTKEGKYFDVVPAWDRSLRASRYNHWFHGSESYMGKLLTVEFRGWTKTKLPSHAVGKAVRDYE